MTQDEKDTVRGPDRDQLKSLPDAPVRAELRAVNATHVSVKISNLLETLEIKRSSTGFHGSPLSKPPHLLDKTGKQIEPDQAQKDNQDAK